MVLDGNWIFELKIAGSWKVGEMKEAFQKKQHGSGFGNGANVWRGE